MMNAKCNPPIALLAALLAPMANGQEPAVPHDDSTPPAETSQLSNASENTQAPLALQPQIGLYRAHAQWLRLNAIAEGQPNAALWLGGFPFASADGQYAAQNEAEIKTYERLAMAYQFIEQPYLRRQLQLKPDEGVFVVRAEVSGDGYHLGFRDGDLILRVDETPVDTQYDFVIALTDQLGSPQDVLIQRDGQPQEILVHLEPQSTDETQYVIGVSIDEISELVKTQLRTESGVAVTAISEQSPAADAGLCQHDVIVSLDDQPVNSLEDLKNLVQNSSGKPLDVAVIRAGKKLMIEVTPCPVDKDQTHEVLAPIVPDPQSNPLAKLPYLNRLFPHYQLAESFSNARALNPSPPASDQFDAILSKLQELEQKVDRLLK